MQPYQSLEVTDQDWLQKACMAIQTQISEEEDGNLVEFKTDISGIPSIDLGEQLWSHWERAMHTQGTRHGLKIKKKAQVENDTLPPPSTGIEDDEGGLHGIHLEPSPDRTSSGRTRHPWTVRVDVDQKLFQRAFKKFLKILTQVLLCGFHLERFQFGCHTQKNNEWLKLRKVSGWGNIPLPRKFIRQSWE